jgi:hypothetical protein
MFLNGGLFINNFINFLESPHLETLNRLPLTGMIP